MHKRDRINEMQTKYANRGTRPTSVFREADKVLMQDHISKKWIKPVRIMEIRPDLTSYMVKANDGREYIRSNRFLQNAKEGITILLLIAK